MRREINGENHKGMGLIAPHHNMMIDAREKMKTRRLRDDELQFPIDSTRFYNFYVRIAKGLYTLSAQKILDWTQYEILYADESFIGTKYEPILGKGWSSATYKEEWGRHLIAYGGFIEKTPKGNYWSAWTTLLYNTHGAGIIFMPNEQTTQNKRAASSVDGRKTSMTD